jgi:hypothetical protein
MVRRSDGAAFGGWLFKCNPQRRDFAALLSEVTGVTAWCVAPTYRRDLIGAHQPALLWVSGSGRAGPHPGLWAVGETTGPVEAAQSTVDLRLRLLDDPLPRGVVAQVAGLQDLEVLRIPAGSNPSWVTDAELEVLTPLLG